MASYFGSDLIPQPQSDILGGDEDLAVESGSPGPHHLLHTPVPIWTSSGTQESLGKDSKRAARL